MSGNLSSQTSMHYVMRDADGRDRPTQRRSMAEVRLYNPVTGAAFEWGSIRHTKHVTEGWRWL